MHVHLPKPLHGWREFIGEIAIIVIGVLIALSAEQLVERWSWGEKVRSAEQTMNDEIKNSLIAAAELKRLEKCEDVQLDRLQSAILRGDQVTANRILHDGSSFPPTRQWADNAFQASLAAQVSDHLGAESLKRYSQTYEIIREVKDDLTSNKSYPYLASLYFMPTLPATPERRDGELREVALARVAIASARGQSGVLVEYARRYLGLATSERDYLTSPDRADFLRHCQADAAAFKS